MSIDTPDRFKRRRSPSLDSPSSSSSLSRSGSPHSPHSGVDSPDLSNSDVNHPTKFHRSVNPVTALIVQRKEYLCTLPPTCSQPETSTSFTSLEDLERHQEVFHRWICRVPVRVKQSPGGVDGGRTGGQAERCGSGSIVVGSRPVDPTDLSGTPQATGDAQSATRSRMPETFVAKGNSRAGAWRECNKVFPEERLWELHHIEVHDPIAREQQSRGKKIFQCLLPPAQCESVFLTPAKRRRHMIDKHHYPSQYFFAVTNHGINRIAEEDGGAGVSMIRPARSGPAQVARPTANAGGTARMEGTKPEVPAAARGGAEQTAACATGDRTPANDGSTGSGRLSLERPLEPSFEVRPSTEVSMDLDELAGKMGSLMFVPRAVGARRAGRSASAKG